MSRKVKKIIKKLHGKTIERAWIAKKEGCDDIPYLFLKMMDGSVYKIVSSYGSFTGESQSEYPCFISVHEERGEMKK